MINQGSTWNKWDLHIHTPYSLFQCYGGDSDEIWEKFILDLEKLPIEITVIGINDYWFLEGYKKVLKYKSTGRLKNLMTVFPVCEFRIKKFAGVDFGNFKRVNLHVIFSPDLNPDIIQAQFLDTLQSSYSLDSATDEITWAATITKNSLIDLGKQIKLNTPEGKLSTLGSDIDVGFSNLNIDEEKILTQIRGNSYLKGKCFTAIGKTEWADLKWTEGTISEKKDIINKVNFVFTCANTMDDFKRSKQTLVNQNVRSLLLDCSDAHNYSNQTDANGNLVRERLGNVFTWIKAEPTFEGLRQLLYEPDDRIVISENAPRKPIRKIERIEFNFPSNLKIKNKDSNSYQDLCLQKIKKIEFSPYFTCLIGGRGTGKSTIINLIAERLGSKNDFFLNKHNGLYVNLSTDSYNWYDLKIDSNNYLNIIGTNEVEFVSQGKVEKLTDGEELNKLIFQERILQTNNKLEQCRQKVSEISSRIDDQIELVFDYSTIINQIREKEKEQANHESVINSVNDPKYLAISQNIHTLKKEISDITNSKLKYETLIKELKSMIQTTSIEDGLDNEYEFRSKEIIDLLSGIEEFTVSEKEIQINLKSFENTDRKQGNSIDLLEKERIKLSEFFTKNGTSQESIDDSQNANDSLAIVKNQIKELNQKKGALGLQINVNQESIDLIEDINKEAITTIQESVKELNLKLRIKNINVAPIHYEYSFNQYLFKNGLFEQFEILFKRYHISMTSWGAIKDALFLIEPNQSIVEMPYETFFKTLKDTVKGNFNVNSNYVKILLNIFEERANFVCYKLLIQKHLNNVFEYVNIKGFYGHRELKVCSFGQKCTAVIVTLLMTGVKPLIIDEPEAHLDNRLIADYLVDLIKEKKSDRQIIFATHNANFVVNGDAELIHILDIPEDQNFTKITSTAIENVSNRDELLKLEGGKAAFRKREGKLLIR